jgi:hypothetical protein
MRRVRLSTLRWRTRGRAAAACSSSPAIRASASHAWPQSTRIIPLLHEALDALRAGDSALRVRLLARLAGARRDDWDMQPRDELSAEAVAIAERIGDPATSAYALISRAMAI